MNLTIRIGNKEVLARDFEDYNLKNIIHKHVLLYEIMTSLEEFQIRKEEEDAKDSM